MLHKATQHANMASSHSKGGAAEHNNIEESKNFVSFSYDFNEMLEKKRPSKMGRTSLGPSSNEGGMKK